MSRAKSIAKNSLAVFASSNISKLITLFLTILIARYVGVQDFGKLSFALSFTALFSVFIDAGTRILAVRVLKEGDVPVEHLVGNMILLRSINSVVTFMIIAAAVNLLGYPTDTKTAVYLAAGAIIAENIMGALGSAFQAREELGAPSMVRVLRTAIRFVITLPLLVYGYGFIEVMEAYLLVRILSLAHLLWIYRRRIGGIDFTPDLKVMRMMVRGGIPFALSGILVEIYFRIDMTMLSIMKGDAEVGLYSAAYGIIDGLIAIPAAFAAGLLPVAIQCFREDRKKLVSLYHKSLRYVSMIAFPLAAGGYVLAGRLMIFLYGPEYSRSGDALKILIWVLVLLFQVYVMGVITIALKKEKTTVWVLFGNAVLNVVLNLFLIPEHGMYGAAAATVLSEMFYFAMYYWIIRRELSDIPFVKLLGKQALASAGMAFALFIMPADLNVLLLVLIGALIYTALLILVGGASKDDWQMLRTVLKRKMAK